jgi:hypothetical protein
MRRAAPRGVVVGLSALAMLASVAATAPPTQLKTAQDLARAHAAWPPGHEWLTQNLSKTGRLLTPVLNRCLPESGDDEVTPFSVYVRLSQKGKVLEVVADISAELGRCMTQGAREVQLKSFV